MSEIDAPSNIPLLTGEGATRVTRASTTSDDSSAQQQSTDQKAQTPEKTQENKEKPATHETAVTISTSLSNLEAGSLIVANYQGIDGQDRPLIVSETGTYVVKFDTAHQHDIDKIQQDTKLEIKILKVEREIEARLVFRDPAVANPNTPPLFIPVTLELTGLGNAPPKVRATANQSQSALDKQQIPYQAADLYRAENIARESAHKLKELPLPATTTNYTLYEKAVPQQDRPAIIRSSIAGNALIAQEQIIKTIPPSAQIPKAEATKIKADPVVINIEKLLHKNTLATVIKNIPKVSMDLPEIVRKQLGTTTPLDNLRAGSNFTLRIDSIAIPDNRPNKASPSQIKQTIAANVTKNPPPVEHPITVRKPDNSTSPIPQEKNSPASQPPGLSGIIIAPGQHILKNTDKSTASKPLSPPPANRQYPDRYNPASFAAPKRGSAFMTLYVATPVSVIKFQSPIELKPGTVVSFSVAPQPGEQINRQSDLTPSGQKTDVKPTQKETITNPLTQPTPENQIAGWTATSLATKPDIPVASPLERAPQPLENFTQNWQSLSQILSAVPVVDNSNVTQNLNNRIPGVQNSSQMTSAMLFFLAAMGAKNPAKIWLGPEITQQLEKTGQGKLLNMLDNDMQRIFRLGADTAPNEWRPALIPLQVGGEVNAIPILTRQVPQEDADGKNNSGEEDENEKNAATRFIVELKLTQFGQIQVDGLLKEKKLNIIIRSKIILPSEMKQRMTGMFTTALEISGYAGDLQFRDNMSPDISVQNIINQKIHMFKS